MKPAAIHVAQADRDREVLTARNTIWNDGKRRVTVAQPTRLVVGHQLLIYSPTEVIADPLVIDLLEQHGVALIELDVNGGSNSKKYQVKEMEAARLARMDTVANELGVLPTTLREALDKGGHDRIMAVKRAVDAKFGRPLRIEEQRLQREQVELERQVAEAEAQLAQRRQSIEVRDVR